MLVKRIVLLIAPLCCFFSITATTVLLEFKGSYFLPTSSPFKKIYKGNALYGPELTVQLCEEQSWYAFASFDYLKAHGSSTALCNPTTVRLFPFSVGIKYFMPQFSEHVDFYAGLGIEGIKVRTKNYYNGNAVQISQWGVGGIAKTGAYCYLPHNFLIDIFIDFSFISVGKNKCYNATPCQQVQITKASINGAIFGAALGYKF